MLFEPDAFTYDWYGWVTNQSGHFVLGMVIAFITGRVRPAVMVAIIFELIQWSPDIEDSITDVAFTWIGAIFYTSTAGPLLWYVIAALVVGVVQRLGNGKR